MLRPPPSDLRSPLPAAHCHCRLNPPATTPGAPNAPAILKTLIGPAQRAALWAALEGEERAHFADIVTRLVATWQAMPATYATESQGRAAVAHLHYFLGGAELDFYYTPRTVAEILGRCVA